MRTIILLFLCTIYFGAEAQDRSYVAGGVNGGFMLAHRLDIKHMAAHNYGVEFAYEKEVQNTHWGRYYNRPTIGYSLLYYDIGVDLAGSAWGGMAHIKFNPFNIGSQPVYFRVGAGLAYLTQRFDVYDNRRNQAIGSNLNGSMQFALMMHSALGKQAYLEYGAAISHYSNAAFKMPNLGYNMPSVVVRAGWERKGETRPSQLRYDTTDHWSWNATAILTKKQQNFADPVDFVNKGIQVRAVRRHHPIRKVLLGTDIMLDKTYKYLDDPVYPMDSVSFGDQLEIGLVGGYAWDFGNLSLVTELGIYAYRPYDRKNLFYERVGLRYAVTQKTSIHGALKFHKGVADYFELGLGYRLGK